MADLTEAQKHEIVAALACFQDVPSIIASFREVHGLELGRKQVGSYDPTRSYYEAGDRWREIFDTRRKVYLEGVSEVPIANQGFRLNELHELYLAAKKSKNYVLASQLLEQAAKEVGGVLTNERNLRVDDKRTAIQDMTSDERRAAMAELIRQALEAAPVRLAPIIEGNAEEVV